jgi:hypothetical protein
MLEKEKPVKDINGSWIIFACDENGFWICNRFYYWSEELNFALKDAAEIMDEYFVGTNTVITVCQI